MRRREKKISNPILSIAVVLLYLTVVTTWMSTGLYARYVVTATGSDGASVAAWDVSAQRDKAALNIDCSRDVLTDKCTVTVQNNSEVAVEYDITVVLEEALPNGITLQMVGYTQTPVVSSDKLTYHFAKAGTLEAGTKKNTHSVQFEAEQEYAGDEYSTDFTVKVAVSQID